MSVLVHPAVILYRELLENYMVDLTKSTYPLLNGYIMASYNICLKYHSVKSRKNFQSTAVIVEDGKEKAISGENMR